MSKKKIVLITCIILGIISVIGIKNVEKSSESSLLDKNKKESALHEENSALEEINELAEVEKKNNEDRTLETVSQDELRNKKNKKDIVQNGENSNPSVAENKEKELEKVEITDFDISDNSGQEINVENVIPKDTDEEREKVPEEGDKKVEEDYEETTKAEIKTDDDTVPEQDLEAEERKTRLETTNPLLYVEDVITTSDTEKVLVNLKIKNNPGVLGMVVSVYFDEKAVSLTEVKNGDAVDDVLSLTAANVLKSGCNFVWDGQSLSEKDICDGALMEMEFRLVPGVSTGKYPIKIICETDDAVDADLQPISFEIVDGFIKVK